MAPLRVRFAVLVAAALTASLAIAGCASTEPAGEADREITIAMDSSPDTLDPAFINQAWQWYVDLAYSPLIQQSSDGELRPSLAVEWGYVGGGNMHYQLKLRPDVLFADGSELDAEAVKAHLEYVKAAGGPSAANLANVDRVEATDPVTVDIFLAAPDPNMTYYFAQTGVGTANVISPVGLDSADQLGTTTFGAGPYVLDADATVTGDTYVYEPNPNYWDKGNIHWDRVTIKVIPNTNSILNALKTGQADFAPGDYTTAAEAEATGLTTHFVPNVFSGLNLMDRNGVVAAPLADQRVRQAINYAIDREAICSAIFGEYGTPTTQTVHGVGFTEELDEYYAYDPERARKLLADAGYPDGFELTVLSTAFFNGDTMVQAIAGQLEKIGIDLVIDSKADANDYATSMIGGDYPAAWIGYGTQPLYIEGVGLYMPNAYFNPFHSEDADVTSLYGQLATAAEDEVQPVSEALQKRLVELAWFAPVCWAPLGTYATSEVDPETATSTTGDSPIAAIIDLRPAS